MFPGLPGVLPKLCFKGGEATPRVGNKQPHGAFESGKPGIFLGQEATRIRWNPFLVGVGGDERSERMQRYGNWQEFPL